MNRWLAALGVALTMIATATLAQVPATPQGPGAPPAPGGRGPGLPSGPAPTHADLRVRPGGPAGSNGHKPISTSRRRDRTRAGRHLDRRIRLDGRYGQAHSPGARRTANPAGYAVAGVSIRSTSQVQFPDSCTTSKPRFAGSGPTREVQPRSQTTSRSWATAPVAGPRRWPR